MRATNQLLSSRPPDAAASDLHDVTSKPTISIVTPCFNAEATLPRTIQSVRAQTFSDWELILVDDGSRDTTLRIALAIAEADARIRVVQLANGGPSRARNAGLSAARADWVLFLDADDWIAQTALVDLLSKAHNTPDADLVVGRVARVAETGETWPYPHRDLSDPFPVLSHHCALTIHSALVRRDLLAKVGGFDERLRTSEDWDLWQRLARTGARFVQIDAVVGFYQARPGSLSRDIHRLAVDAMEVMHRGHAPDPRVPNPVPAFADGDDPISLPVRRLFFLMWAAARDIALGGRGLEVLHLRGVPSDASFDPDILGELMASGMADVLCVEPADLRSRWPEFKPKLERLFDTVGGGEGASRSAALALGIIKARLGAGTSTEPDALNLRGRDRPALGKTDHLVLQLRGDHGTLGVVAIPLLGAPGPRTVAEAAVEQSQYLALKTVVRALRPWTSAAFWKTCLTTLADLRGLGLRSRLGDRDYLTAMVRHRLRACIARGFRAAVRARLHPWLVSDERDEHREALARLLAEFPVDGASSESGVGFNKVSAGNAPYVHDGTDDVARTDAWNRFFATDGDPWNYENSEYEQLKYADTLELVPDLPDGAALELACAEGHFSRRLAPKVATLLASDISDVALRRASERCSDQGNVSFTTLDLAKDPLPGGPYDLIVCSEVLYYLEQHLGEIASRIAGALKPGGLFVTTHANLIEDEPEETGFDWGHTVGARKIGQLFATTPGLHFEREIRRPLYRVQAFRRVPHTAACPPVVRDERPLQIRLDPPVARNVVWGGGKSRSRAFRTLLATSIPVLTYHRIALEGPKALARFRVSPHLFESQMQWLRREGYWGVAPEHLLDALRRNRPLVGRPVMITFDDGYQDFYDHAWPILEKHDFPATVFVVPEKVGGRADWDEAYGEAAPLMDWNTLRRLSALGASIESHSGAHRDLTRLTSETLYRDLAAARARIAAAIGRVPTAICYPFSSQDRFVTHAASACGYDLGFTSDSGVVGLAADPLRLPRVEITGVDNLDAFARKLGASAGPHS